MPLIDQSGLRNVLLRRLQPGDFAHLAPHLEPVELHQGEVLAEPHQPFAYATFPERGIVSLVSISPKGEMIESGLVGREGFAPVGLALYADRSPQRTVVQVPGQGHRIAAQALREVLTARPGVHRLLLRYSHALTTQAACTALSNAMHPVAKRLARWLLMCHDRATGDEVALTQRSLSIMLAVRRPSVTNTMRTLEDAGFVQARRGLITIIDRPGLEAFAGDAYGQPEAEYDRLVEPLKPWVDAA